jgi:hypothetical protein
MEFKSARHLLESAREARLEVFRCEERLEVLYNECRRITAKTGEVGGGGGGGDLHKDGAWAAYADLRAVLSQSYENSLRLVTQAESLISRLPNACHRAILSLRYLAPKPWKEVIEILRDLGIFYEERQVYNHHRDALEEAEKLWEVEE